MVRLKWIQGSCSLNNRPHIQQHSQWQLIFIFQCFLLILLLQLTQSWGAVFQISHTHTPHHRSFPFNSSSAISICFSCYHPQKTNYIPTHIWHDLCSKDLIGVTFTISLKKITFMFSLPKKCIHLKLNVFNLEAISAEFSMILLQQSSYQVSWYR